MYCRKCGSQISAQETACPYCGQTTAQNYQQNQSSVYSTGNQSYSNMQNHNSGNYDSGYYNQNPYSAGASGNVATVPFTEPPKKKMSTTSIIIITLVCVLFLAVAVFGVIFLVNGGMESKGNTLISGETETAKPSSLPSPTATPKPSATPSAAPKKGPIRNPGYTKVTSRSKGVVYEYPSHFEKGETEDVYIAPDGTASLGFYEETLDFEPTPKQLLNAYIENLDGTVVYSASGSDWLAFSLTTDDGQSQYVKSFVDGNRLRRFIFITDEEYLDSYYYKDYIEYLEDHFKRYE